MTSFVLTFRNAADRTITEAEGQAWMEWFGQIGSSILDAGSRVGSTNALGAAPSGSVITGYTVIKATDLEAAVLLAKGCPGLAQGGAVEVGELVAM